MRAKAIEIRWHGTKSIYSADFQPSPPSNLSNLLQRKAAHPYALSDEEKKREQLAAEKGKVWRLATAGGDNMVMTWLVHPDPSLTFHSAVEKPDPSAPPKATQGPPAPAVEYLATLAKHQGVVNVVRFCPKGEVLASAGDDGNVLLWVLSSGVGTTVFGETAEDRQYEREAWRTRLMLRGPAQCEIYDIAWSPCGDFLLTGDTAKTARIWNATDGQCIKQIQEHSNFVQGVAWDPLGQYIATQSSDRSLHIYTVQIQKDPSGAATADVQHVGKHSKMDVIANPGGTWSPAAHPSASFVSSPVPSSSAQLPPAVSASSSATPAAPVPIRPTPKRSISVASDISMRSEASSAIPGASTSAAAHHPHRPPSSSSASASLAPPTPSTSSMQPPSEIPHHHPHHTHTHVSNTASGSGASGSGPSSGGLASVLPVRSHSRQSSASTHASPALSASRIARSPSPAPPLPAVNVEAEHHFRHRSSSTKAAGDGPSAAVPTLHEGGSGGESSFVGRDKGTIKLYGDEGASAFFRRLEFSTDGALLISPAGRWGDPWSVGPSGHLNGSSAGGAKGQTKDVEGANGTSKKKRKIAPAQSGEAGSLASAAEAGSDKPTVYIYGRAAMGAGRPPLAHLPGHKTSSVAIRFSPIVYQLRKGVSGGRSGVRAKIKATPEEVKLEKGKMVEVKMTIEEAPQKAEEGVTATAEDVPMSDAVDGISAPAPDGTEHSTAAVFSLPYRMVYAVATHDAVFIYDTQQAGPVCILGNLHYASFTDLAWTADGDTLVLSSSDGYCSLVAFDVNELGTPTSLPAPLASVTSHHRHHHPHSHHTSPPAVARSASGPGNQQSIRSFTTQAVAAPAACTSNGEAPGSTSGEQANTSADAAEDGAPKKKRRVALTFEGPTQS